MNDFQLQELITAAVLARQNAYAPYSRFAVGAALWTTEGAIYRGCNVENASFGAGLCAERNAGAAAIAAGDQQWVAIAVALSGGGTPCGICRQFLSEFARDLTVITIDAQQPTRPHRTYQLQDLFPHAFSSDDLADV